MSTASNSSPNYTNHFLIATPELRNSLFEESLIYICRHNEEGAFGIVINKPTPYESGTLFEKTGHKPPALGEPGKYIYFGGPVSANQVFVLHRPKLAITNHLEVANTDIAITSSTEILEELSRGSTLTHVLFAIGYAGWDAGQLEQEVTENSWIVSEADCQILFEVPNQNKLKLATRKLGFEWHSISGRTGHA